MADKVKLDNMFWSKRISPVEQLTKRLQRAAAATDIPATVSDLASEECKFLPWTAWALIGLARHRQRQRWVTSVVRTRLQGSTETLHVGEAFARSETLPQQGVVPGLIDWEYYFHGIGCCLTHRTTGESIDVDFHDDAGDYFDDWFYIGYLQSLKSPEYSERRLIELHRSYDALLLAFEELKAVGALEGHRQSKVFKIAPACEPLCNILGPFVAMTDDPARHLLLSVAVGDWLKAADLVGAETTGTSQVIRKLAAECREARIRQLLSSYGQKRWSKEALTGLLDIHASQVVDIIRQVLRGAPGATMSIALGTLLDRQDSRWAPDVFQLFQRLSPLRDIPEPHAWVTAAEYLLRLNCHRQEVIDALHKATNRETGQTALLALEFAPNIALELFRCALQSTIPHDRSYAAAILAILDEPWGIHEMVAILNRSHEREFTSAIRGALVCSRDLSAHEAVLAWEQKHPMKPHEGIGYTWEEVAEANRDSWLQHQMDQLHDRVMPLRGKCATP